MDENFAMGYAMGQDNGNNNNGNGLFGGDGGWLGILLLIALLGGGIGWGGGFGGFGGGAGLQGMATRADINEGFALNNITSGITAIQQGICDATYAINNGLRDVGMNMMQGFNGVERGFCDLSHQLSDCCCENRAAIAQVRYDMATQACDTRRAIQDSTRSIMDFLTQDKISTLTAENQALKFAASQAQQNAFITANQDAQTAELIRRLGRDCPVPAFVVPNPNCCYGNPLGVGYNGYGNGCGCTCA